MSEDLPRVLFVTPHAFNHVTGGGITFSNLFRGWPKDQLACVHSDPEPTTDDVCAHYYNLTPAELSFAYPLNLLKRVSDKSGDDAIPSADPSGENGAALANGLADATRLAKKAFLSLVGESLPEQGRLTPNLEAWIEAFKPDVIYTILGSNGMMALIESIRKRFDLPIVTHIMDDWMSTAHRKGLFSGFLRRQMRCRVRDFMDVSVRRLGISYAMCEAFEQRYGVPFEPFQNTIDTTKWGAFAKPKSGTGETVDLLYVGSIFPNAQLDSLERACRVVEELNESGFPITLTISSPSGHSERHRDRLAVGPAIRIIDTIRDDEAFFRRIAEADILLLPVNFDEDSIRFIRLSMPTKVPAYLTVGTPILAYGPAGLAQIEYARAEKWGYVVDQESPESLKDGIKRLAQDVHLRQSLSSRATEIARLNHDMRSVRTRFQRVLTEAAQTKARGTK